MAMAEKAKMITAGAKSHWSILAKIPNMSIDSGILKGVVKIFFAIDMVLGFTLNDGF